MNIVLYSYTVNTVIYCKYWWTVWKTLLLFNLYFVCSFLFVYLFICTYFNILFCLYLLQHFGFQLLIKVDVYIETNNPQFLVLFSNLRPRTALDPSPGDIYIANIPVISITKYHTIWICFFFYKIASIELKTLSLRG